MSNGPLKNEMANLVRMLEWLKGSTYPDSTLHQTTGSLDTPGYQSQGTTLYMYPQIMYSALVLLW